MRRVSLPTFLVTLLLAAWANAGVAADSPRADVNKATAADLQRVKRIGPKTSAKIIEHRTARGGYKSLAEIAEVKGIGPKTLGSIACHFMVPSEGPLPCGEVGTTSPPATGRTVSGKINLNLADESGLTQLPGIGPKKAALIVSYRSEHGYFDAVDDLQSIKGFGPKTVAKLAPHLVVRVRVNEATEAEFRALGFGNAARILEYRRIVGRFHSTEDLEQIPELDAEALAAVEDLLLFD